VAPPSSCCGRTSCGSSSRSSPRPTWSTARSTTPTSRTPSGPPAVGPVTPPRRADRRGRRGPAHDGTEDEPAEQPAHDEAARPHRPRCGRRCRQPGPTAPDRLSDARQTTSLDQPAGRRRHRRGVAERHPAAGWTPKLGLDLAAACRSSTRPHAGHLGGARHDHHHPERTRRQWLEWPTVASQARPSARRTHSCALIGAAIPGQKNTQADLQQLGKTPSSSSGRPPASHRVARWRRGRPRPTGTLPTARRPRVTKANINVQPDSRPRANSSNLRRSSRTPSSPVPVDGVATRRRTTGAAARSAGLGNRALRPRPAASPVPRSSRPARSSTTAVAVNLNLTGGCHAVGHAGPAAVHAIIGIDLDARSSRRRSRSPPSRRSPRSAEPCRSPGASPRTRPRAGTSLNYGACPSSWTSRPSSGVALAGQVVAPGGLISAHRPVGRHDYKSSTTGPGLVVVSGLAGHRRPAVVDHRLDGSGLQHHHRPRRVIGIIVSIGITVDSYIVYFERSGEARSGRTVRTSVDRGFKSGLPDRAGRGLRVAARRRGAHKFRSAGAGFALFSASRPSWTWRYVLLHRPCVICSP